MAADIDSTVLRLHSMDKKEEGKGFFIKKQYDDAAAVWKKGQLEIEEAHQRSSWAGLVDFGGLDFVVTIAEYYMVFGLNRIQVNLIDMKAGKSDKKTGESDKKIGESDKNTGEKKTGDTKDNDMRMAIIEEGFKSLSQSMEWGFWKDRFQWVPPPNILTKYYYRQAIFHNL
jgi:hypothetical protein